MAPWGAWDWAALHRWLPQTGQKPASFSSLSTAEHEQITFKLFHSCKVVCGKHFYLYYSWKIYVSDEFVCVCNIVLHVWSDLRIQQHCGVMLDRLQISYFLYLHLYWNVTASRKHLVALVVFIILYRNIGHDKEIKPTIIHLKWNWMIIAF